MGSALVVVSTAILLPASNVLRHDQAGSFRPSGSARRLGQART